MLNKNHTILNSSGCWASNETQLDELFNTKLNAIITKTCTLHLKKEIQNQPLFIRQFTYK